MVAKAPIREAVHSRRGRFTRAIWPVAGRGDHRGGEYFVRRQPARAGTIVAGRDVIRRVLGHRRAASVCAAEHVVVKRAVAVHAAGITAVTRWSRSSRGTCATGFEFQSLSDRTRAEIEQCVALMSTAKSG